MLASSAHDGNPSLEIDPARRALDPWRPLDVGVEREPASRGGWEDAVTLFLTGAECPLACVFCDLARYTLPGPTPQGALPEQIRVGIRRAGVVDRARTSLKLYNASNFFEDRAVPRSDDRAILREVDGFGRVVVECHPRWIGPRFERYAEHLGSRLEVAMGLETAHPAAFERLGKGITLDAFDRAARRVLDQGASLRVFVLVGAPFVPPDEGAEWLRRTVRHAATLGARFVSLIPLRPSGRLRSLDPTVGAPSLADVESALERSLCAAPVVAVDPWDLAPLSRCDLCFDSRAERLHRLSAGIGATAAVTCPACSSVEGAP